jgi:hypothetical protein
MNVETLKQELKSHFENILSLNLDSQKTSISKIYCEDCLLKTKFIQVTKKYDIMHSYQTYAISLVELKSTINTILFDGEEMMCVLDISQTVIPKTLGGMAQVQMNYLIQLQLEIMEDGLAYIVQHTEVHQDSMVPVLGNENVKNIIGQLSLTSTDIMNQFGLLDMPVSIIGGLKSRFNNTMGAIQGISDGVKQMVIKKQYKCYSVSCGKKCYSPTCPNHK